MKPYHVVINISMDGESLPDIFTKLADIFNARHDLMITDDEQFILEDGVSFQGEIEIHPADKCPYPPEDEEKEPWQQQ